jgi:hypothetical protein
MTYPGPLVLVQAQWSLANPLLRGHVLQLVPPAAFNTFSSYTDPENDTAPISAPSNVSHCAGSGPCCPAGSVPVLRTTLADVAHFAVLRTFLNISWTEFPPPAVTSMLHHPRERLCLF